jgi:hypothetical protein
MAEARTIEIPDFDFSGFYYPDLLRSLIQYQRVNVPEITDESDEEPFQQLLRCYSLIGHLNNVLLDITANESLLPTARLLESVRGHLALIDVTLRQATPAVTDIVLELSKVFTTAIELVPRDSQFSTVETEEVPQVIYETNTSFTIQPSNVPTGIFVFEAGLVEIIDNAIEAGNGVNIEGVDFRAGVEYPVGGDIPTTLASLAAAINTSGNENILKRVHAISDETSKLSIIPLNDSIESIAITKIDTGVANFNVKNASFGANRTGLASTDGVFFDLFPATPKKGDILYVIHQNVLFNTLEFIFNTFGSGIEYVVEFYDNTLEDAKPDLVTNNGSNLTLDLTTLLGTENRSGSVVRVVLSSTGAQETLVSQYIGGVNVLTTGGLLGQSAVSLNEQDYVVGTKWNEVGDTSDLTNGFTEDGKLSYTLPQSQSKNWLKRVTNAIEGYAIRVRIIEVTAPVNPNVDRIRIDTGTQYVLVPVSQGQTVTDDPVGSSNGDVNLEFLLTQRPLIEGTLLVEVDEGSGFQPWNQKENFLSSNSASKDYTLQIDANDNATIKFGDGKQGRIPSPGVDNIRALYRIGADVDGNVGARTVSVNKSGISFISRVFNPRQAIGWSPKEGSTEQDLARLKVEGPATLRTRGRAIATIDFEFLATQFVDSNGSSLVARALAIEETFGVKTVEVVVVGFAGALLTEVQRNELTDFFNGSKALDIDPVIVSNHEATIVNYTPKVIDVTATVTGGVKAEIENAITALLNPEATFNDGVTKRWDFGQEVPLSVIVSEIFEVDPVNIKKVVITVPQAIGDAVPMNTRELPFAGSISATVI